MFLMGFKFGIGLCIGSAVTILVLVMGPLGVAELLRKLRKGWDQLSIRNRRWSGPQAFDRGACDMPADSDLSPCSRYPSRPHGASASCALCTSLCDTAEEARLHREAHHKHQDRDGRTDAESDPEFKPIKNIGKTSMTQDERQSSLSVRELCLPTYCWSGETTVTVRLRMLV